MLISQAHAQEVQAPVTTATTNVAPPPPPPAPDAQQAIIGNVVFVAFVVIAFYFLLIRPQQKRFKEHADMLSALKKGDKIVTGGGLIGTIDKFEGTDEVVVDLGNGIKVTAVRSTLQTKTDPALKPAKKEKAK